MNENNDRLDRKLKYLKYFLLVINDGNKIKAEEKLKKCQFIIDIDEKKFITYF
jgi:hypothetical protein